MAIRDEEALEYHAGARPGKTEVVATKPCLTARDLSLAYTPGVAVPCLVIEKNPADAYKYTNKGNLVAVLSNGTAVLGLGDIGALAGKPVMEGKGVLFKRFAHVDVFDIEVNTHDPDEVIKVAQLLEPTFGGINLEDIKAPECFYIEETLKKTMKIPVFHDDQHGTAIISGAALVNACEVAGKDIKKIKVVVSGAGAAAIACAKFYELLGVPRDNFLLVDTKGVVFKGRKEGMNPYKEYFAQKTELRTLAEAMKGADVFLGCSVKGLVTKDMVRSMAKNPIVFAMANPDPEITYTDAKDARKDVIMATGRSDYPNQVNNVLGFPFIFRGALDVRATAINEAMKLAASHALAALAKEPVPENVSAAYSGQKFTFGPDYIIPKPFDPRVLYWEAPAVAKAACETGVALNPITDWDAYRARLEGMTSKSSEVMRTIHDKARKSMKRIVFPDGEEAKVIQACREITEDGLARPILLGHKDVILERAKASGVDLSKVDIFDPKTDPRADEFARELHRLRCRSGVNVTKANRLVRMPLHFAAMMLRMNMADGMVAGARAPYVDTIRSVVPLLPLKPGIARAVGMHLILKEGKAFLCADTTVNVEPDTNLLVEIALQAAAVARHFGMDPRIAMLSFSNFGDNNHPKAKKVRDAVAILHEKHPDLCVDGEMHGDVAVLPEWSRANYPQSKVQGDANVLVFPDLESGNIAYKLVTHIGKGEVIGPMLVGLEYPINVVSYDCDVREIVNMAALSASQAQKES
ncbi:MAG: NADP-dependent malic enzyme [Acidobacteria bacterium]|nr:NADP-dependent malic enzyme [Acidobacteriota bacterium]